jgi:hypothetical protein
MDVDVKVEPTPDGDVFVFVVEGVTYRYNEDVLMDVEDGALPLKAIAGDVWRGILYSIRTNWQVF